MKILVSIILCISYLLAYNYPNYRLDVFNDHEYQEMGYVEKKRITTNYFYAYYIDNNYGQLGSITRENVLNSFVDNQIDFKVTDTHERIMEMFVEPASNKDMSYNQAVKNVRKNAPEYSFLSDFDAVWAVRIKDYGDMNSSEFKSKVKLEKEFEEYHDERDNRYKKAETKAIATEIFLSIIGIALIMVAVRLIKKVGNLIVPIKRTETIKRVAVMVTVLWVIAFSIDYRIIDWFSDGVNAEDFNQYFIVAYLPIIILYGIYWILKSIKPSEAIEK